MYTNFSVVYQDELYHHGIKGQKWGIRRFQNKDGSLTAAGKDRYTSSNSEYERNAYQMSKDKKAYKEISKNLDKYSGNLKNSFKDYYDACLKLTGEFDRLSERHSDFDGDGTEFHWFLEKRYPEYKKLSEQHERAKKQFINDVKDYSTWVSLKSSQKYKDLDDDYGNWEVVARSQDYAIGQAVAKKYSGSELADFFPDEFRSAYTKKGEKLW